MTRTDHRTTFTALGFLAVILQDVPGDKQALRAKSIARLIESFCTTAIESVNGDNIDPIDHAIDRFKAELISKQDARLPQDRDSLIQFYRSLQERHVQRQQALFFARATEDVIANHVLQMIDQEIEHDRVIV